MTQTSKKRVFSSQTVMRAISDRNSESLATKTYNFDKTCQNKKNLQFSDRFEYFFAEKHAIFRKNVHMFSIWCLNTFFVTFELFFDKKSVENRIFNDKAHEKIYFLFRMPIFLDSHELCH